MSSISTPSLLPTLLLVDGHSLAFRSFYAFAYKQDGGLCTSTGIPTSICYGFLKSLLDILQKEKPTAVAIAFDLATPTFRHDADVNYKAGRKETPENFIPDLINLQQILEAMNIKTIVKEGYEADDILGTLSQIAANSGYGVKILSGDQDLFQLIDDQRKISVLHLGQKDKISEFHAQDVKAKLGVMPNQIIDYKALCGDNSDNISGVRGIGEKTAVKLLDEYGSLENILASIPNMKGAVKQKLEQGIEDAKHSQFMAKIIQDVEINPNLLDYELKGFDTNTLIPLLETLELKAFINKIDKIQVQLGGKIEPKLPENNSASKNDRLSDQDQDLWFDFVDTAEIAPLNNNFQLEVQIIDTPEKLEELKLKLESLTSPVAWDTETTALNPHDAKLVGIGCCWGEQISDVAYIPIAHLSGQNLDLQLVIEQLKPILESSDRPKVFQNTKFDRLIFKSIGIDINGVVFDTMIASYVIDPDANHGLSELSKRYLQITPQSYKELLGKHKSIAEISIPQVANYCGMDAYSTWQIMPFLKQQLVSVPELSNLYYQVELPLEIVLAEMEWLGIRVDREYLQQFSQELEIDLDAIAKSAYKQVGKEFNLNSPKQLSEILIEKLGETFTKKSRKSSTGYSTDVAVLNKLQGDDPLIDTILENRTLAKLKSTYVDALPALIHPQTQRVHTDFNQTVTSTGRLSSSNPNLQNIPIKTAFSRRIRSGFLPESGWLMLAADYSQIELRILAHLSQEPELVKAYNQGIDVHTRTAQLLLEKDEVTSEERRLAKIINYGVIYGMGAQKFSRETGIPASQAKKFIEAFNKQYAQIFTYMKTVEQEAETQGFVTTVLGRRRYFHELKYTSGYQKAAMLRSAVNAPIQGTSADIIKVAMIGLHKLLKNYRSRLLLQVHDELVLEILPEELTELQPQIKSVMESAIPLSVPLVVDIHIGKNWMEAK
ncbi:DNA polymerase I [Synechococcus sp. PCC 7502]|uniref:DNA polymerase I n=1 Tax=Synechococcus sp. PCC 7502 TaxID=1173263 RepID=UPI00029FC828|nr:DNA polymerase I [Synechococcus sp. PCC 7502]AFY73859.1 DNA polymerase I [Synechococcus sp. PCC 7502]